MTPSKYQQSIFAFVRGEERFSLEHEGPVDFYAPLPETYEVDFEGRRNAVVEAVAGSGKTTTIVKTLDEIAPSIIDCFGFSRPTRVLFVAFNSHIAKELDARVPKHVKASTLNSVGWGICRDNVKGVQLDANKNENILRTFLLTDIDEERKLYYKIKNQVSKMVGLMKAMMFFTPEDIAANFISVADKYDVDISEEVDFLDIVQKVFAKGMQHLSYMDFDDQIAMPVANDWTFPEYDWVFGDEAQDWSPVQIELVKRLGRNGRIVAVGDRFQSIYGFRGADPNAIENIIASLDATTLSLSICYRCPDRVIAEARKIVKHIENPVPNSKGSGIVETIETDDFTSRVKDGDYVLCRTTAPLVKRCLQQIRAGKKATVKGKDLGRGLLGLLDSLIGNKTKMAVGDFLERLAQYRATQVAKLTKAGREQEASNVEDRCDTLEALALDCNIAEEIKHRIDAVFSDTAKSGIIFMTGHRCKGLEADRIFILRPDLCPHPKATKEWQQVQDMNLLYVMRTRAMKELYYVRKEREER